MAQVYDVAIVGLGPVGGVLAALLGRVGFSTVVLDKAQGIFPLPRAIGFDHEIMRVMQNLGLAEAIAPYAVPYRPTQYRGADGQLIARYTSLPPPYPEGWEPSFVFSQPPFEQAIRDLLTTLDCVHVHLSTELIDLVDDGERVTLRVRGPSGEKAELYAHFAVGCDGGAGFVRRHLAIRYESLDFDEPWLVVDVQVADERLHLLPAEIVQYCNPARPTTYVIGPGNHRRWEFMLLPGEDPEAMNQPDTIWRLLAPWLKPGEATLWRSAPYVFHALVAERWRRGRVFLAGDAAHMTPPFMAQGMCQGIRDAANLAWKLGLVLDGAAADNLLDTYPIERQPHVVATTQTAKALGRVICERDWQKARSRDLRMIAETGDPPKVRYRQSLIPGLTQGALCHEQGPPVGLRLPQPLVATQAGPQRLDDVAGACFRLVLAPGMRAENLPPELISTLELQLCGAVIEIEADGAHCQSIPQGVSIVECGSALNDWLTSHGLIAALVRPDHYILATASNGTDLLTMAETISQCLALSPDPLVAERRSGGRHSSPSVAVPRTSAPAGKARATIDASETG